jgi:hypothetical protein
VAEQDRVEPLALTGERQLRMRAADDSLVEDRERVVEYRRGEALAPDFPGKRGGEVEREFAPFEASIRFQNARELRR